VFKGSNFTIFSQCHAASQEGRHLGYSADRSKTRRSYQMEITYSDGF